MSKMPLTKEQLVAMYGAKMAERLIEVQEITDFAA